MGNRAVIAFGTRPTDLGDRKISCALRVQAAERETEMTNLRQGSSGTLARVEQYGEKGETFPVATQVWHEATFGGETRSFATHEAAEGWLLDRRWLREQLRVAQWFETHPEIAVANAAAVAEREEQ